MAGVGRAFADAKDVLEAQKFLDGLAASNEPVGILSTAGALTTTRRTLTNTTAAVALGDVYSLKGALPPRWQPQGVFAVSPGMLDTFNRFGVTAGRNLEDMLRTLKQTLRTRSAHLRAVPRAPHPRTRGLPARLAVC